MIWKWYMTKKEFYIVALIVVYTYLAIIFQINLKNLNFHENGSESKLSFNIFK